MAKRVLAVFNHLIDKKEEKKRDESNRDFDPKIRPEKMIVGGNCWLPASLSRLSHETAVVRGARHQMHSPQSSQMGSTQSSCKKTGFPTK